MGQFPEIDLNYVASVLADIWGREHGCKVTITLTPKEPAAPSQQENRGGPVSVTTDGE